MPALPTVLIIGAMKCGTTAVHRLLDRHPDIAMAAEKELNFFFGPAEPAPGQALLEGAWHRGVDWYAARFDERAPVRGEASPGYTSPAHPEAAERIAALLPEVRLIYLVRDPVERAISQYRHHRADGSERRPIAEAVLDPGSQYLDRSRFYARLEPYLARFPLGRIRIVAQEELRACPARTMRDLCAFAGADPDAWPGDGPAEMEPRAVTDTAGPALRARIAAAVAEDADRLRALTGREFPGWSV